jgi:hypothetical protein
MSETSVDNYFTRQYIPEDNSELDSSMLRSYGNILGTGQSIILKCTLQTWYYKGEWISNVSW